MNIPFGSAPASILDRVRHALVGLKMPRALEVLDHVVRRLEQGELSALEAIDTLLAEELTLREKCGPVTSSPLIKARPRKRPYFISGPALGLACFAFSTLNRTKLKPKSHMMWIFIITFFLYGDPARAQFVPAIHSVEFGSQATCEAARLAYLAQFEKAIADISNGLSDAKDVGELKSASGVFITGVCVQK